MYHIIINFTLQEVHDKVVTMNVNNIVKKVKQSKKQILLWGDFIL